MTDKQMEFLKYAVIERLNYSEVEKNRDLIQYLLI